VTSARGGTSRCLLVTGEAGIGKSRLVAEAAEGLGEALVLTGHAADMSTGEIPFGVVADTLRDLVRVAGPTRRRGTWSGSRRGPCRPAC
jgi:predicted ATPase